MNPVKHLILGTAGHIDHGKTALIKALTGIDCDTHAEEKQRGITINLGFAHCDLPTGTTVSVVDVPGHKDFIHTMVAGASGIDFVLLVIAADSGIMPQTREHMQIMAMLNLSRGVIALTKTDLVDADIIDLAREEIAEFTKGTFLEQAPVVPVSALTGDGIEELRSALADCADSVPQRPQGEVFRLFIDRIFSISGFGTVVTGSVISGILHTGDHVYLLPGGKKLRVRRLERHSREVDAVMAGDRASLNCVGLNREDFKRGMILSDRILTGTTMIDVRLSLFPHARKIFLWSEAIFLLGTYEAQARIHLLDDNTASGGDTVLAQVHLPQQGIISVGDRFIIRSTSSDITLGGGEVIDAAPLHHRRRPRKLIDTLAKIAEGKLSELVAAEARKRKGAQIHTDIAERLNVAASEVLSVIREGLPEDILALTAGDMVFLVTKKEYEYLQEVILKSIQSFHRRNPLEEGGRTIHDLLGVVGMQSSEKGDDFIRLLLAKLAQEKKVKQAGSTWASAGHTVKIADDVQKHINRMDTFLKSFGMKVPLASDVEDFSKKAGIDPKTHNQILRYLTEKKRLYRIDSDYLHADVVDPARMKLLKALLHTSKGLTVAQFRDLIADNRKICLRLFALFDQERVTERRGDVRFITEKGRKLVTQS